MQIYLVYLAFETVTRKKYVIHIRVDSSSYSESGVTRIPEEKFETLISDTAQEATWTEGSSGWSALLRVRKEKRIGHIAIIYGNLDTCADCEGSSCGSEANSHLSSSGNLMFRRSVVVYDLFVFIAATCLPCLGLAFHLDATGDSGDVYHAWIAAQDPLNWRQIFLQCRPLDQAFDFSYVWA